MADDDVLLPDAQRGQVGPAYLGVLIDGMGKQTDGGWTAGDLTGDRCVGLRDASQVLARFGDDLELSPTATVTATAIPEPTTLALLAAAAPLRWLRRRRPPVEG